MRKVLNLLLALRRGGAPAFGASTEKVSVDNSLRRKAPTNLRGSGQKKASMSLCNTYMIFFIIPRGNYRILGLVVRISGGKVVSAKNLNITNQRNPKNTKTESSTTISKNITSPPNLRCVVCLVVLINNKCSFVYFHELKVEPVSTIPDLNIDTRETLGLFVALFRLNLNEHK